MRDYEDIVGHRKRSVLPEAFQLSLVRLCRSLGDGRAPEQDVRAVISALSQLPPESYLRAGREIANIGRLYDWYEFKRPMRRWRALSLVHPTQPDNDLLSCTAGLEFLYLFHGNGFLRERALAKIAPPLESAFFFNSIAYRLNDWVEPVRKAAQQCAARVFPHTSAEVVAEGALVLLERMRDWQRWDKDQLILQETLGREDVRQRLSVLIAHKRTGPASRALRELLRDSGMDEHLVFLSREARQPAVRAVALQTLIEAKAFWPEGYRKKWIDKSMGLSRRVPEYGERELVRPIPVERLVAQGAADKSALVRRVAADGLVKHRNTLANLDELLRRFAADSSEAVRERAHFVFEERRKAGAS